MTLLNWLGITRKSKKNRLSYTKSEKDIIFKNQNLVSPKEQLKYYKSIYDCKIENYFKVLETGDSRYLYYREFWDNLPDKRLDNEFDDIFWQYQEESGLDDKLKMSIEYKAKILDLQLKELTTGKGQKPFIAKYEMLLNGLKSKSKGQKLSKRLAILRKWYGQPIPLTTTLFEYIGIEKLYIEDAKSTVNR